MATSFRGTWLTSSLRATRERGLLERYLERLPRRYHEPVLNSVVGEWLPVEVAVAHYEAMDQLRLPEDEIIKIGLEVTERFHRGFYRTVFQLAKAVGATPWTILAQTQKMWDRTWVGGGLAIWKSGPSLARGHIVGWPCARVPYCRVAMRGVMLGTVALFCKQAMVSEIPGRCTDTELCYRMTWS